MISRNGTLLEKNVEKIFKLAGFKTKRNFILNGYEIDVFAEYEYKYKIAIQCKQYERSNLNIRDVIHQWDSKSRKLNIDRVLIVIYGNEVTREDIALAESYGMILWGEKELEIVEDYVMNNIPGSFQYLLDTLKMEETYEHLKPKSTIKLQHVWLFVIFVISFVMLPLVPFVSIPLIIGTIIYLIVKSKKKK